MKNNEIMSAISGKAARRGVTIRTYLLALVLAAVIPLGAFAAALLLVISNRQESEMEAGVLESARTLAATVSSHVDSSFKRLTLLANETSLRNDQHGEFAQRAREALATSPDWRSILMVARNGTQVVNTLAASDVSLQDLPSGLSLPFIKETIESGQPVISRLFVGRISKQPVIGISIPVVRDGTTAYALSAALSLKYFRDLASQVVEVDGGVAALLDQDGRYVARSLGVEARVGEPATERLRSAMSGRPSGVARLVTAEGVDVVGAWARVPKSGWSVFVGAPLAAHKERLLINLSVLAAIWLLVAVSGVLAATYLARRIVGDVSALAEDADVLATGEPVAALQSSIYELQSLGRAHQHAALKLRDLLKSERQHRERAEAENKSKDEFLAMLGHELRNPLGAISNASQVLRLKADDPEMLRFATDVITRQAQQLRRLIDDLLDVNRIISGKIALARSRVDLAESASRAVEALESASAKGHTIELRVRPTWIDADPARIEQIASNLVSNAIAHTPPGGHVVVEVCEENEMAVLRVRDSGEGIEPAHLPRIFDLFYQAPQALDRAKGGLGIGLTLVKRLTELHGGSIAAESAGPGTGSTFTVRLPLPTTAVHAPDAAKAGREREPSLKILIIEDDDDSRDSLKRLLELNGHSVAAATDGRSGLAAFAEHKPDIAIVDIGLPLMSGYEVAGCIREEHGTDAKLIALTGYGRPEDAHSARQAGFDEHLVKPVDLQRLLDIVAKRGGAEA